MASQENKGWFSKNWKWLVPVVVLSIAATIAVVIGVVVYFLFGTIRSPEVYQQAILQAESNEQVVLELGKPFKVGWPFDSSVNVNNGVRTIDLKIPLSGPKQSGTIYVIATKERNTWNYSKLEVEVKGKGQRIDLLPQLHQQQDQKVDLVPHSKAESFKYDSQLGLATIVSADRACLDIKNPNLGPGEKVQIVFPDQSQLVIDAKVGNKIDKTCAPADSGDEDEEHYELHPGKVDLELTAIGIAIVGSRAPVTIADGTVSADLDGDGVKENFRTCASMEGLHLTVWSGKPLQGKRRWHSYYYLGYDLESNCNDKDYDEQ